MGKIRKMYEILSKYKVYIFVILVITLSIISILIQHIDRKNSVVVNSKNLEKIEGKIAVYITGQIKNPGVYYIREDLRLGDLIDICGGFSENADIEKINLAKKLVDSEKIIIPAKKAEFVDTYDEEDDTKININEASLEELMTIPSIGDITASKIIEYRNMKRFDTIEDIMNVSGIGKSKFNTIREYICVD